MAHGAFKPQRIEARVKPAIETRPGALEADRVNTGGEFPLWIQAVAPVVPEPWFDRVWSKLPPMVT